MLRLLMFMTIILCSAWPEMSVGVSQDYNDAITEISSLAERQLEYYNACDGVQHVGGPFKLSDYLLRIEHSYCDEPTELQVLFVYKHQELHAWYPDLGKMWAEWDFKSKVKSNTSAIPDMAHYCIIGNIASQELSKVLLVLRTFLSNQGYTETREIAQVRSDNIVTRHFEIDYGINCIKQIAENKIQVILSRPIHYGSNRYDQEVELYNEQHRWIIRSCRFNNRFTRPIIGRQILPISLKQQVQIYGSPSDDTLIDLINAVRCVKGLSDQLRMISLEGRQASVYAGEERETMPSDSITLWKDHGRWAVKRQVTKISGHVSDPSDCFPFLPKPSQEIVDDAVKKTSLNGRMAGKELRQLCEILLRLPYDDNAILCMSVTEANSVEAITARICGRPSGKGHVVQFRKINGIWIITNVKNWVS